MATTPPTPQAKPKPKKRSARTTALGALLALVAVLAAWLSNCIPGFGFGGAGEADGEAKSEGATPVEQVDAPAEPAKPAEPTPTPAPEPAAAPVSKTLEVRVDMHGCSVAGAAPSDCKSICERAELFENIDDAIVQVDGASQASVVDMLDCLKTKGIDKVAVRREPTP